MNWGTKRALNNLVLLAVVGVGLYFLYGFLSEGGTPRTDVDGECHAERGEMVSACRTQCNATNTSSQLRAHGKQRPQPGDCVKQCYQSRFGRQLPTCTSHRKVDSTE